jgi:rhodanese-related sulfurtransferase
MAAGMAVKMGYNNVFWYKDGMAGWKKSHNFLETENLTYSTRQLPKPTSARQLREQLDKGQASVILVDLRDEKSREKFGIIHGETMHIPLYDLVSEYRRLPYDKKLVLYDIRGKQAPSAVRYLLDKKFAFSKISWLDGGAVGWTEKGYPVR